MIDSGGAVTVLAEVMNPCSANLETLTISAAIKDDVCDVRNEVRVVVGPLLPGKRMKATFKLGQAPADLVFVDVSVRHSAPKGTEV